MDPFDTRLLSQPRPHSGDPLDHKLLEGHEPGLSDPFDTRLLQGGESTRGDAPRGPRRLPHADQFYEGLKSGTAQLSGTFAGLGALVANELGMHTERDALQKRMFEKQHEAGQAELAVRDIAEIDNPSDFLDWASGTLGQVAPSVALSFGGGGVGGLIGRGLIKQGLKNGLEKEAIAALTAQGFTNKQAIRHAVRLQLANPATHQRMIQASRYGTGAGAWASSAMPVTGETLMTLRDAGLNIDEAAATAFGVGALGGALDALPTVMLLDKFFPGVDKELAKSFVRQVTETLAQQTGMEFLTEGSQEAIQIAAHAYHDPSFRFSDAGNARQILNAAAAGALAGAATGGAGGVAAASMDGVGKAARKASDQVAKWHEQAQQVERTVMGTWRETPGAAQEALDSALNVGPIVGLPITGTRIAQPYPVEQPEAAAQLDEIATSRTSEEITAPGFIERIYQEHGGRGAAYLLARVRKQLEVAWRQADAAFQNDPDNVTAQNELFAAQERLSALDDALARFRDQQGTQSEPETLTGHEAFEQFKKGVADLWHENVTKTLDSAFNEARRVVRQLGLGDTSVGAQQVPFMKRVLTDLDLATYKVVDPVVQEAGTQLRTLIERGQEAIDAATDPVIRQEITENLMEQAREQLTAIRQRLETMTQQAEQEVAGRDHTSDPFEVAAAQNETLLNDAEKADAFFKAAEQKAREGNDGLAEVRAGLLRKWARHRKEEGWVEQEIASRRRRLARPGNTRRFERTLQHEIRILQEDSFESAAERLMNHSRSLVQEVAGTPGPPAPPAPPTTPEADTSWLDRQRTRLFEGVPDPAGLGKELTPAQIDQAAQVLQDRADAVRRAIPEEKNKGRQDELMQLLTEALDRRQALLDSKPRQQEQKAPEKKPDPAAKLKSLREESRALSEAIDAVIGRIAKLIGADPRRVNSDLHSAELDDGLEGVLRYINRGKGRTPEAAALAAEWDAASDAHRAKYDEAREFYVANKEALAAHPDAIDNFISALEKLPRLADGTRLDITRKLVKAMYQNRNDPEWLASEISGRERRLAKYKKESGETALTKLIELELKLLREGDLQGMLDTLGKEFTSEYMHAWPVPNLAAMEKAAAPKQEQQQKAPEQKAPEKPKPKPKPKVEPTELPAAEAARKTLFGFVPRSVDGVMGMTLKRARANLDGFVERYVTFTGLLRGLQARIAADPANPTLLALSKQYARLQKDAIRIGKALRTKATPSRRDEAALADLEGITPEARIIEAAVRAARSVIDDKADELAARIEQIVKTIEDPRTPEAARRNLIAPLKKLYAEIADVRDANKSIPKVMRALKEAEIADDIKNLLGVETLREAAVEIVKVLENRHARYSIEAFTQTDPDALVGFFNEVDAAQAWGDGEGSVGLVNETTDTFVTASAKRIRVRIIGKKTPQPVYKRMSVQAARELLEKNGSAEALAALEGLKNLDDSQKWMEPSDFLIIERHGFKGIEWKSNEMRQSQRVEITEFDKEGGTSTRFIGEVEPWVARQDGKPYENTLNALEKLEADELARAQVLGYTQPSVTFRLMKVEGGYVIVAEQIDGTPPIFSKEEQGNIPLTEYLGQVFDDAVRTGNKKREDNARVVSIDNDGDIGRTRVDVPTLMRMGLAEVAHQNLSNYADRQFETLSLAASVVFALLRGPNGRVIHGLTDSTIMYDRGEKFEGGKRYITWGDLKEKNPKRAQLLTDPGFLAAFQRSVIYRARRALGLEIEILPNKTKDGARDKDAALSPEQVAEYTSYWGVRAPSKLDGWSVFGLRSFIQKQLDRGGQVSGGRVKSIDILTKKDPNEVMTSKEIKAISAASKYRFPNHLRGLTVGMAREQLMALGKNPDDSFVGAAALQVLEGVHESKLVVPDQYQAMEKAGHKFAKNAHGITAQKLIDHLNEVIAKAESQLRAARRTSDYRNGLSFDKEGDGSHVVIHHGREGTTAFSDQDAGSSSIKLMTLPEAEALADQMRMTVGNSAFAVEPWTLDGGEFFADATPGMFSGFVITETVGGTEPAPAFDQARTRAEEEVFESSEQGNQDNRMLDTEENQLRTSTTWYKNQGASLGTSGPTTAEAAAQEAALLLQTRIASRPQRRAANVVFDDGTQAELARTIKETQEREKQLQLEIQSVERRLDELRKERVKESSKPPTKEQNAEFDSLQQQERDLHKQLIAAREAPARVGTQAKKLIEKVIDRVAKAMGLTYEFAITTDPNRIPQLAGRDLNSLPPAAVSFGWFKDGQGDGRVTIFLNPKKLDLSSRNPMQDAKLINALAHEMGHVVFWSYFDSLPVGLKARLYEAWAAENPGAATQFDGSDLSRRALLEDSARPFEEWMADQFIAYARDDAGMLGLSDAAREAGAQGWFTNLVDKLKQLWEMLTEHLGLNQEFKDFADGIRRSMDPINGPNNYTQAAWETSALPDDLPINVVRFMEDTNAGRPISERLRAAVRAAMNATPGNHRSYTGFLQRTQNLGRAFRTGNSRIIRDTLATTGEVLLYSMNGRIRIMAESFPALKKLVTEFKPAAGTTGTSYRNRVHTEFSRFTVKLNSIIDWRDNLNMDRALENALIGDIPGRLNYLTDPASPLNAGERQHVQDVAVQVRAVMDEMHKYAVEAGVPMGYTANYWPRVVDPVKLRDNANEVIQNLVTKLGWTTPHARDFVTKMLGQTPERRADTTQAAVDHAFDDEGQVVAAPWTESVNERSLTPGQFDQVFGDVRQTDVRLTLHNYITQLTKTAEFNRSFGQHKRPGDTTKWDRTARLRAILGEAMEQGMSEQEYREIQTMVDTLMGRVGITLPGWARHATSAAILYQNVRVLLFSVFSSFPDLATTVVRAGSYKTVHAAWKADLKNVVNKDSDLYAMARAWGVASDAITKSVVAEYSSSNFLSGWAKNISETYFKAIGLNAWTNFTRVAALAVGKQFLVEHMQGAATNPDSVARLTELGLTPADVQAWVDSGFSVYGMTETLENTPGAGRSDRARMESLKKVRDALVRFTDEAVLRPDASQRPVWASDPRFVLLWHLKSFMYAFHETLNKRVYYEMMKHRSTGGPINLMPLLHAALVFPLALLGLELREIIQYRLGGKEPRSRRLDPMARMIDLTARTGVLGPAQMVMDMRGASQRQSWAITGVAGPTASHLYELFAKPWTQTGPKSIPVASQIPWLRETVRPAFKSDSKPAAPKQRRQMSEGETKLVTGLSNSPALPAKAKAEIQSRIDAGKADTVLSYALYSKDVPAEARSMLRQVVHSGYAD